MELRGKTTVPSVVEVLGPVIREVREPLSLECSVRIAVVSCTSSNSLEGSVSPSFNFFLGLATFNGGLAYLGGRGRGGRRLSRSGSVLAI